MANERQGLGAWSALRLGLAQAVSLWPAVLLLFLAEAAQALVFPALLLLFQAGGGGVVVAGLLALAVFWLIAELLRVLSLGGAVRQAALRLRGLSPGSILEQALDAAPRALGYLAFALLLDALVASYRWLLLGSAGWLYLRSLLHHSGGALSSAGLALAITISAPLGLLALLWTQVALARAVARGEGYLASLYATVGELWARPWSALAVVVLTGVLAWVIDVAISVPVGLLSLASGATLIFSRAAIGVPSAFASSVLLASRLDALAALELDATRELPQDCGAADRPHP